MKALSLVLVALLCAGVLQAAVPQTMSYQGVLRDGVGNPVPDDDYNLTFAIYDVPGGGSPLWAETQGLTVEDGILNAVLGSGVPIVLPFDTTYWLGISVEGEPELSPRTELTSAPYAQRAAYADVGADTDWTIDGDDIYRLVGNVGIGQPTPSEKLDVEGTAKVTGLQLTTSPAPGHVLTSDAAGVGTWQPVDPLTLPYSGTVASSSDAFAVTNSDSGTAIRGHAGGTGEGGFFSVGNAGSSAAALHAYTEGTGPALYSHATGGGKAGHFDGDVYVSGGNVGIGLPNPSERLDVDGTAKVTGFQLTTAPTSGHVLMSDASGVGSWQAAPGTVGGGGTADYVPKFTGTTTIGNSAIYETGGDVAIGTTTAEGKLTIESAGSAPALSLTDSAIGMSSPVLYIEHTEDLTSSDFLVQMSVPSTATDGYFIQCNTYDQFGSYTKFAVSTDGHVSSGGIRSDSPADEESTVRVYNCYAGDDGRAIDARYASVEQYDAVAVYGESTPADYYGIGGRFVGGYVGAEGKVEPEGSNSYRGLRGTVDGGSGNNYGVVGDGANGNWNVGIYGTASGGAENWAGYFFGDARVTGTFVNPGPVLEIDHPADPENRYLRHALVASPEMKSVYDGLVVLDSAGEAWVELPDWFEALNGDFRYQLTPIGAPAPGLYVAETVSEGRFRIAGGEPGMTVSWQVTGIRHDAHARQLPLVVEEEKEPRDRGRYLSPEAHGVPQTLAIGRLRDLDGKLSLE